MFQILPGGCVGQFALTKEINSFLTTEQSWHVGQYMSAFLQRILLVSSKISVLLND